MTIRPWAEFTTDLPDDSIENEDGFVRWPGKGVSEALAAMLTRCGCEVSEPVDLDFRGWELAITAGTRRVRCRVALIEKYLIGFYDPSWLAGLLRRNHPDFLQLLKCAATELAHDPRFHDVRWLASDEMETDAEGASFPVPA